MEARERIEEWRTSRGLTVAAACDLLDITPAHWHLLRRGKRLPGAVIASVIEEETGIPAGQWGRDARRETE